MICRECQSGMCLEDIEISADEAVFFFECPLCDTFCRRVAFGDVVTVDWYSPGELLEVID